MGRNKRPSRKNCGQEDALKEVLSRLKRLFNEGHELEVVWIPARGNKISGEVRDGKIYIYESDPLKAEETLTHEFVDYLIAKAIHPYLSIVNNVIKFVNEQAYEEKEKIVDRLTSVILPLVKPDRKRDDHQ